MGLRDEIGAESHLYNFGEPQGFDAGHDLAGAGLGKSRRKRRARQATTFSFFQKSSFTAAVESWTAFAPWWQTRTQEPQAMHRSSTTFACPSSTLMVFAGHLRTQV